MSQTEDALAEIKAALAFAKATKTTTAALQDFLGTNAPPASAAQGIGKSRLQSRATGSGPKDRQIVKQHPRNASKSSSVVVHEDRTPALSPKEKYGLATEIASLALKTLSKAAADFKANHAKTSARGSAKRTSREALEERSANSTPSPAKSTKAARSVQTCGSDSMDMEALRQVAESVSVALAYLSSMKPSEIGPKSLPALQIESAIIAAAGRMLSLGFKSLATKELHMLKMRLEALYGTTAPKTAGRRQPSAERPMVSLMGIAIDMERHPDLVSTAISHQLLSLQLITRSQDMEAAYRHISLENSDSPAHLIVSLFRAAKTTRDTAIKQLQALSVRLLDLSPCTSASTDEVALNATHCPSPLTTFQLQALSLDIRRMWWDLAAHSPDLEKEIVAPFRRALAALQRRYKPGDPSDDLYQAAASAYDRLGLSRAPTSRGMVQLHRILANMASQALKTSAANSWNDCIMRDADASKSAGALQAMARLRHLTAQSSSLQCGPSVGELALQAEAALNADLSGTRHDYDMLLSEVAMFVQKTLESQDVEAFSRPLYLCGELAQRYHRSYPETNGDILRGLISSLLSRCRNPVRWINLDSVSIFIESGALAEIACCPVNMSWDGAWSANKNRVALDQSIMALLHKHLAADPSDLSVMAYGDKGLDPRQRLVLLTRYLTHCVDLSTNVKFHEPLKCLLPHLVASLLEINILAEHPLHRVAVDIMIGQLQEVCPELAETGEPVGKSEHFTTDEYLHAFSKDLYAGWTISTAFAKGHPTAAKLKSSITTWHSMLTACKRPEDLEQVVYNIKLTCRTLRCCADYLAALGEDALRLLALQSLSILVDLSIQSVDESVRILLERTNVHLNLLQSELAGESLDLARRSIDVGQASHVVQLQLCLVEAEYYLAIDHLEKAKEALHSAEQIRSDLEPRQLSRADRLVCQRQHGLAWLLHSVMLAQDGDPHEALSAGRRCFKILNSDWSLQDQRRGGQSGHTEIASSLEPSSAELSNITAGISKLRLKSESTPRESSSGLAHGSQFWSLIPLFSRCLRHLSTLYAHHGLYTEADWYSTRAVKVAEEANTAKFAIRAYLQRVTLLCLAGRIEDAELCLEKARQHNTGQEDSLLTLLVILGEAEVRESEDAYEDASSLYEQSRLLLARLRESVEKATPLIKQKPSASIMTTKKLVPVAPTSSKARASRIRAQAATLASAPSSSQPAQTKLKNPRNITNEPANFMLEDLSTRISLKARDAALRSAPGNASVISEALIQPQSTWQMLQFRQVQFRASMNEALGTLESDFALNVLPESTVSVPGVLKDAEKPAERAQAKRSKPASQKIAVKARGPTKKVADVAAANVGDAFNAALNAAEYSLLTGLASSMKYGSTATTYLESHMLAQVTMYRAATALGTCGKPVNPATQALYLEQPKIKAHRYAAAIGKREAKSEEAHSAWHWPSFADSVTPEIISSDLFQQRYIDILPAAWSALSLTLNEDCTELFAIRYRRGRPPLTLRLPLSQQDEDENAEEFHFGKVKEEFDDIIAQSNFSCHNTGDVAAKGGKRRWWLERQALDKRLQGLLINIENLWFGGFRGILSGSRAPPDAAARFEATLESTLGQYLPSRKANKSTLPGYRLDTEVIELFTGLAREEDATYDVDEAIADLLYFIVDMLQFGGERNAYDEIDFDRMTVAVADALRAFHEDHDDGDESDLHLVLVLEKRLQSLPWENLPSMEGKSVSRVGSMESLRECILAAQLGPIGTNDPDVRHVVDSHFGTYILNPSGDLTGTREAIEPALLRMPGDANDDWTSIVNRAPSEEEFAEALSSTKILLYFGHGAGSQYIRPRTIKKQEKCSEVVWLMGCSSGAVTEYGQLEPSAVPLTYLQAGGSSRCLAVVATLWDVTDKDIDRYSLETGERWGLWPATESAQPPAKTPRKRVVETEPSTPKRPPKTPKTPRVHRTPIRPTTPTMQRGSSRDGRTSKGKMSLTEAVATSREACFLRYLNGAAPVVYGIPVYLAE